MLRGLTITDMLIIDRLDVEFQPGLNVLTGETGAGKSILLDCLGFVLGWRGRAELVRQGAAQGEVIASFDIPPDHAVNAILEEAGIEAEPEIILRRINTRDGRKTAFVNDKRCSGQVLRKISETLLELHGQHDDRGLLNAKGHMALLDEFAQTDGVRAKVRNAWKDLNLARGALEAREAEISALKEEEDFLRHAVGELQSLDPKAGEEAALDGRRRMMQASEKIRDDVALALKALQDGAEGHIIDAQRWLDGAAGQVEGQLDAGIAALSRTLTELGEAAQEIETVLRGLDFDPAELEACEERLFAMRAAARKHSVQADELAGLTAELAAKLDALETGTAGLEKLQQDVDAARATYETAANHLSADRKVGAGKLDSAMAAELAPLKMERAVFTTNITPSEAGPTGTDSVAFSVATNPGAPAGPLEKIASGGELSRFLLALKVCLSAGSASRTMIFDEIDRGVGGATADAVGRRLSQLGDEGQVLVVTHSPQVAALGNAHWRVEKRVEGEVTLSTVVPLVADSRRDEIARMLSGDVITDQARAAANALLKG